MRRRVRGTRWLGYSIALMTLGAGCARPVSVSRHLPEVQAQTRCYVNVAEVARRHPMWPSAQRTETAPALLTPTRPLPPPLGVQMLSFPSAPPEMEPPSRPSVDDERRRYFQQLEAAVVREFETTIQQIATQRAETEIQRRLAQESTAEEAKKVRLMENLSQQLSEDLSRWREQELQQLARETQPRRLRLSLKTLSAEARQKLEDELKKLEADAAARLERKQQDVKKQIEMEERHLREDARQRLNDLEQSLRRAMPSDVSLASHRERLASDFAPQVESKEKSSNAPTSTPIGAAAAKELSGYGFRISDSGAGLLSVPINREQDLTRNAEVATLRAYLLRDTAKRVRQLACEHRWQLVSQRKGPGVVDKTQECIRLLHEGSWQMMKRN